MVYLATAREQPTFDVDDLNIQAIEPERTHVQRLFSLPFVRFVGAHTGCSCGFPSIGADEPIEYYEEMFPGGEQRRADVNSLRALLDVVNQHVATAGAAELYPVWNGEVDLPPKGSLTIVASTMTAERFFLIERFLYRIGQREPPAC